MLATRGRILAILILILTIMSTCVFAESGLPSLDSLLGKTVPSVSFAIGREPIETDKQNGELTLRFDQVTDEDLLLLDRYLIGHSCNLEDFSIDGTRAIFTVVYDDEAIRFEYDNEAKTLVVTYPANTRLERSPGAFSETGGLLPDISAGFIIELPNMQTAIGRTPAESYDRDDQHVEIYNHFSRTDYSRFSTYLQTYGCSVSGYEVENDIMTIGLSYKGLSFTFVYDPNASVARLYYPINSHLAPTPAPTAVPTPRPTEAPFYYSESECWSTAYDYFVNLSWKNPNSLTVHGHTSTFSDGSYTFYIDYSAQNGFGGYNRTYYIITVDASTRRVTNAFGN